MSKLYDYHIKNFLTSDYDALPDLKTVKNIFLCAYMVNTAGKFPFLQYLLSKHVFDLDTFNLPCINEYDEYKRPSSLNVDLYSKIYLATVLHANFQILNEKTVFDGFYIFENNLYLFYDLTECSDIINQSNTNYVFALIHEIMNEKYIESVAVNSNVVHFFTSNQSINYLYDTNNNPYEIPIVGYVNKSTPDKVNFTYIFGETAKDKSAILGPHYYFTNYRNTSKRYIVRFALFIGNAKYIENAPNDPNDESSIKKDRLNDDNLDKKFEALTMRISDHDGIWSKTYDSAHLGKLILDDGTVLKDAPLYVLKEYKQQVPLTFSI